MNLIALQRSNIQLGRVQVLSLQSSCISCIVEHLDEYFTEHLSLLPTKFRRQLLTCLPPLDILKLEGTSVVSGLDMNEVWHVIAKHYAEAEDTSVLPRTFKTLRASKGTAGVNFYNTIKDDWRSIFLTRTLYLMIHTFNPSSVATKVVHCSSCKYENPACETPECSCWGLGMDRLHHDIFWRLIALPLRSELNYSLSNRDQTSNFVAVKYYQQQYLQGSLPFKPKLLVPKRHASYLADSSKNTELLSTLLKESRFRPKVVTINCGFMHYSEFNQHLESSKCVNLTYSFLADMLSEVECLEFYWPSMTEHINVDRFVLKSKFDLDASLHTLTTVLGAILQNPSPKLISLCVSTGQFPTLHNCLPRIAPFFSAHHYTEASKNRVLPINMAYAGLKNVHIFAVDCPQDISSIILHQSGLEGIEIEVDFMSSWNPELLLAPIQDVISQRQLQFFAFAGPWHHSHCFENTFQQFLKNNHDFEIFASVDGHAVTIPASSSSTSSSERKTFLMNLLDYSFKTGCIFSWLRNAQVIQPLKLVKSNEGIDSSYQDDLKHYLSSCEALNWSGNFSYNYTSILQTHFRKTLCPNLQTISFKNVYPTILLTILPALFASAPQLKELCLSSCYSESDQNKLEEVLECLVSCPYPEQLTVDLRGEESLTQEHIEKLLQVWRKIGQGSKLKAVMLQSCLQPMVAEMMLQMS